MKKVKSAKHFCGSVPPFQLSFKYKIDNLKVEAGKKLTTQIYGDKV
jgi:hypothetical protein